MRKLLIVALLCGGLLSGCGLFAINVAKPAADPQKPPVSVVSVMDKPLADLSIAELDQRIAGDEAIIVKADKTKAAAESDKAAAEKVRDVKAIRRLQGWAIGIGIALLAGLALCVALWVRSAFTSKLAFNIGLCAGILALCSFAFAWVLPHLLLISLCAVGALLVTALIVLARHAWSLAKARDSVAGAAQAVIQGVGAVCNDPKAAALGVKKSVLAQARALHVEDALDALVQKFDPPKAP